MGYDYCQIGKKKPDIVYKYAKPKVVTKIEYKNTECGHNGTVCETVGDKAYDAYLKF